MRVRGVLPDAESPLNVLTAGMGDRGIHSDQERRNCWRTLEQVLHTWKSQDRNEQWNVTDEMLNVLDLPLPRGELEPIPRWRYASTPIYCLQTADSLHRAIASHIISMQSLDHQTDGSKDVKNEAAHTSWATVSTPGVISRVHAGTSGLCTVSMPLTGEQYWAVGEPRAEPEAIDIQKGSVRQYKAFDAGRIDDRYRWEAVSLNERTAL